MSFEWEGRRVLGEIEETSLSKLLTTLRGRVSAATRRYPSAFPNFPRHLMRHRPAEIPVEGLETLARQHRIECYPGPRAPRISVSGAYMRLVYALLATLLGRPLERAVVVVDCEDKFEADRVLLTEPIALISSQLRTEGILLGKELLNESSEMGEVEIQEQDLQHLYIYKVARENVHETLKVIDEFMVYGDHSSKNRQWWGVLVIGGPAVGGDLHFSRKGWLHVQRVAAEGFEGIGVCEALQQRERRNDMLNNKGYIGRSKMGDVFLGDLG